MKPSAQPRWLKQTMEGTFSAFSMPMIRTRNSTLKIRRTSVPKSLICRLAWAAGPC